MFNTILLVTLVAIETSAYRLPTIYIPVHYDLDLTVLPAALTSESNTFTGSVTINFTVTESTSTIQLHANPTYININTVLINSINLSNYTTNSTTEIVTITLASNLIASQYHNLTIEYTGLINNSSMSGFYKSSYNTDSGVEYLVTTDFEATNARKAFPCWDEPAFKATYQISLTYPFGYTAIANTPGVTDSTTYSSSNLIKTTFNVSPIMSTYLVAFVVSKFTSTEGDFLEGNSSMPQKVWSRSEAAACTYAANLAPKYIDIYNKYTNLNYSLSLSKLDQVALPDFTAGAMENWGLVTYREASLLYYEKDTANLYRDYIARVISHELAHQWFGNLVTMKWWSEIFLNEGFATFFEYYVADQVVPELELMKQFNIKVTQSAFQEDASNTVKAIMSKATTPSEIAAKFNTVNYDKAGSILRMVKNFLGEDVFRAGLQTYLNTYKYSNSEPANLWDSFSLTTSSVPVQNLTLIMENWINNPGFPLLTVSLSNSNQLVITQERFLYSDGDKNSTWYVPLSWTTSENVSTFEDTSAQSWLTPSDSDITVNISSNVSWIILNNQQTGYFRVNYDSILWSKLTTALQQPNFSGIIDVNRAQIVDDAFNLARAHTLNYSNVFRIVEFLKHDTSYYSWYPAITGFSFMLKRFGLSSSIGQKISEHILDLSESVRNLVSMDFTNSSDHIYSLNQQLINKWACELGHNSTITLAQQLFETYRLSGTKPDKNLRNVVYCNAIRYSSNISQDWSFLWSEYEATSLAMEKLNIIAGLGCTTNETILNAFLEKILSDSSGIRSQDYSYVISAVYTGSEVGVNVALEFLTSYFYTLPTRYTKLSSFITGIAAYLTTEAQVSKLSALASNSSLDSSILSSLNTAIATANSSLEWVTLHKSDLYSYYQIKEDSSSNSNSTTVAPSSTTEPSEGMIVSCPKILTLILVPVISFLCLK